jgi:PncC family amidohydrolase
VARDFPRVARLYGPVLDEVVAFCRSVSAPGNPLIAWDAWPEVHVKCPDRRALEALLERFGDGCYSLDGTAFEVAVVQALAAAGRTLATAESCTGGLVSAMVTEVPGSSDVFRGGVVAYANAVKQSLLGVPAEVLAAHGAVSAETVQAMAAGARAATGADIAVAVSGVAGPGGGTPEKPVGTAWIAWDGGGTAQARCFQFPGGRDRVRRAAAFAALEGVRRRCMDPRART